MATSDTLPAMTAARGGHQPPVILLGVWNPAFLTIARSCAAAQVPVHFVAVGDLPGPFRSLSACLAGGGCLPTDEVGTPEGIQSIVDVVKTTGAGAIIPVCDRHILWLAANRHWFEPQCQVIAASSECLQRLRSKRNQIRLAHEVGLPVLPTWYLSNALDAENIADADYPLVLRPDSSTAAVPHFKIHLARSPGDLARFLRDLRNLRAPVIAQPFRSLPNLLVHGVRSSAGEVGALQAFLVYRKYLGVSLSLRPVTCPPDLARRCADFVAAADVTGCFHFEFLQSPAGDGPSYFLEINARFGGSTDKVARLGFDEPRLTLEAFGCLPGARLSRARAWDASVVNKRAVLSHLRNSLRGRCTDFDYPNHGPIIDALRSLYELLFVRDALFSLADVRGTLWSYRPKQRAKRR